MGKATLVTNEAGIFKFVGTQYGDTKGKAKIVTRIDRLGLGNPGDVRPVGDGVSEMRIDFGPGYRVYYKQRGDAATVLCGGDKDSQDADIRKAKALAEQFED